MAKGGPPTPVKGLLQAISQERVAKISVVDLVDVRRVSSRRSTSRML